MAVLIPGDKNFRKNERRGTPIRKPRSVEVEYREALEDLNKSMRKSTRLIGQRINEGVQLPDIIRFIEQEISASKAAFDQTAFNIANRTVRSMSARNKEQIESMIKRSLGVDFATILDSGNIAEQLEVATMRNAQLIKTIPEEHWARVVETVTQNYRGVELPEGSLSKELKKIGDISDNRARIIARDQTAKLATDLTQIRQEEVGIESYIWRTAQDNRVVGKPGGLYPEGNPKHMDHWEREGKEFKWSEPPPDGHPGQAILCRCRAEPVINLDKLDAVSV